MRLRCTGQTSSGTSAFRGVCHSAFQGLLDMEITETHDPTRTSTDENVLRSVLTAAKGSHDFSKCFLPV